MGTDELFKKRKTQGNAPHERHPKNLPPQKIILIICEGEKNRSELFQKT